MAEYPGAAWAGVSPKADLNDADLDRIAKAVRGQFAANPLK